MGDFEIGPSKPANIFSQDKLPPVLSADILGAGATVQSREPLLRVQSYTGKKASFDNLGVDTNSTCSVVSRLVSPMRKLPSNVIVYEDQPQSCSAISSFAYLRSNPLPDCDTTPAPDIALVGADTSRYSHRQQKQAAPLCRRSRKISTRSGRSMSFGYPASHGMADRFNLDSTCNSSPCGEMALLPSPTTAVQRARAPNFRAGLTNESVPGDPSFLTAPKRLPSRLLKMSPSMGSPSVTAAATVAAATGNTGSYFASQWDLHSISGNFDNHGSRCGRRDDD